MIDTMTINNGSNGIDIMSYLSRKFSILPYNNVTVAVCNTFDLSQQKTIDKIHLVYNTEIEVYFHLKDQFLYEWIKKKSKFLPSSSENVRLLVSGFQIEIFDIAASIAIESKSSIRKLVSSQSFNDCFRNKVKKLLGKKLMECYLDGEFEDICLNLTNIEKFEKYVRFLQNDTFCPLPETYMNNKVSRSNYLPSATLEVAGSHIFKNNHINMFNEDLGFKNISQKSKPNVTLKFHSFTKISKVSTMFLVSFPIE